MIGQFPFKSDIYKAQNRIANVPAQQQREQNIPAIDRIYEAEKTEGDQEYVSSCILSCISDHLNELVVTDQLEEAIVVLIMSQKPNGGRILPEEITAVKEMLQHQMEENQVNFSSHVAKGLVVYNERRLASPDGLDNVFASYQQRHVLIEMSHQLPCLDRIRLSQTCRFLFLNDLKPSSWHYKLKAGYKNHGKPAKEVFERKPKYRLDSFLMQDSHGKDFLCKKLGLKTINFDRYPVISKKLTSGDVTSKEMVGLWKELSTILDERCQKLPFMQPKKISKRKKLNFLEYFFIAELSMQQIAGLTCNQILAIETNNGNFEDYFGSKEGINKLINEGIDFDIDLLSYEWIKIKINRGELTFGQLTQLGKMTHELMNGWFQNHFDKKNITIEKLLGAVKMCSRYYVKFQNPDVRWCVDNLGKPGMLLADAINSNGNNWNTFLENAKSVYEEQYAFAWCIEKGKLEINDGLSSDSARWEKLIRQATNLHSAERKS